MGSDLYMAAQSFRPRPLKVIRLSDLRIEVQQDTFPDGYHPIYRGAYTPEVHALLTGLGAKIPRAPRAKKEKS